MIRRNSLKITYFFVILVLIINVTILEGQTNDMVFDWEPFQTRMDLVLQGSYDIQNRNGLFPSDEFSSVGNLIKGETSGPDVKNDKNLDIFRYRKIRLYLSNLVIYQNDIPIRQPFSSDSSKLDTAKSLPSMLLNFQYRDTFESIGGIFEPQINLGIEF
jgi:hypothetical protein